MEIKTTPFAAVEDLVKRIRYKPGWEFNIINVGVCFTTIEQNPEQRMEQERQKELWRRQSTNYFEWEASNAERGYVDMMPRVEPKTMVWRDHPFQRHDIIDLPEEIIVGKIWEMVVLIEAHEIKEFFRVDGLCVQEPHPEAPRELAYGGALDRWDFMADLMGGRHGGFDAG